MSIMANAKKYQGFSLLEMVVALVILGILIISLNGVFKLIFQTDHRLAQIYESQKIKDALETYLVVNSRLPCPDDPSNGINGNEDVSSSGCRTVSGVLPFNELGVKEKDVWGNYYFYRIIDDAASSKINDVCSTAGVFGLNATVTSADLYRCSSSNQLICDSPMPLVVCDGSWESVNASGSYLPHFSTYTRVYDSGVGIDGQVLSLAAESGDIEDQNVLAVAISWGSDGDRNYNDGINSSCDSSELTPGESENCNNDRVFVKTITGLNKDYVVAITLAQAKKAITTSRKFR